MPSLFLREDAAALMFYSHGGELFAAPQARVRDRGLQEQEFALQADYR